MVASRLSNYCEAEGIFPKRHCGLPAERSTKDTLFVVRRLEELREARRISLYTYVLHYSPKSMRLRRPRAAAGSARTRRRKKGKILAVIRQFHEGMPARVFMDDGRHS